MPKNNGREANSHLVGANMQNKNLILNLDESSEADNNLESYWKTPERPL